MARIFMNISDSLQLIIAPSPSFNPTTSLLFPHVLTIVKISSEVAIRPAQFSVYVLGGSVGFPEVLDLVPKVLKLGASSAVRSAVVLNIMSETLVVFVHLSINAAKAFVVKMKVLVVIFRASDLGFEGGVLCSRRAMHLLQVFEYFAEPSSTRTDLEAGVI
ncbi:hypothetical protein MBLNU13_g02407t1 [Cladosporium sp. NU13]